MLFVYRRTWSLLGDFHVCHSSLGELHQTRFFLIFLVETVETASNANKLTKPSHVMNPLSWHRNFRLCNLAKKGCKMVPALWTFSQPLANRIGTKWWFPEIGVPWGTQNWMVYTAKTYESKIMRYPHVRRPANGTNTWKWTVLCFCLRHIRGLGFWTWMSSVWQHLQI